MTILLKSPSASGVQERVTYTTNSKGQKVKVITKVKVTEIKRRIPKRVQERKNLPRFGEAKIGEENVTLISPDFVSMEHPADQEVENAEDPGLAKTLANFINKQAEKKLIRDNDLEDVDMPPADEPETPVSSGGAGVYVPPSLRQAAAASSSAGPVDEMADTTTLRVSNLTKAVTEVDLRDLFERFGRISRVSLPLDAEKLSKGYAYIAYVRREDAEKAMDRLQGYGYDHLILKIEWAKPPKEGGGGGGMGSSYSSGYGKKLAQDTSEKATFFSQQNR